MGQVLSPYQEYQHLSKYSRWSPDLGRRETWPETAGRYFQFWDSHLPGVIPASVRDDLEQTLIALGAVPSMRCLMTAGPALEKDNAAGFNCTYMTMDRVEAWDEAMYLLMCGTGVGYSVEQRYTDRLPIVPSELHTTATTIMVADSKLGWASAFRQLTKLLYGGFIPRWDTSRVRPEGSILHTFGGRASGPLPLEALFRHVVEIFQGAVGRRLTRLEVHSICCKIGDIVVVGGVRRSAMIALFDEGDRDMYNAKIGQYPVHFGMANNSAVYEIKPTAARYLKAMGTLVKGQSGEPGIFNRQAAQAQAARYGKRDASTEYGCNPCGEIILRDREMCNLSEVIARPKDTEDELLHKIEVAAIFGTLQSTLTNFRYLSPQWRRNCEEERLLGSSIAGVPDHPLLNGSRGRPKLEAFLDRGRERVWEVNAHWASELGIPAASAATCLKPSGNTSQFTGAASPLKPWHGKYFIRRTRGNKTDPVSQLLVKQGVPHEDEAWHPESTWVYDWPMQAPTGAATRHDWTALDQLELWLTYHEHWCDHKPSCTINVNEDEWLDVAAWVWRHWEKMSGVAFLPGDDHKYVQAPYEEITEAEYRELCSRHPTIDWTQLSELEDRTTSARELSCSAGACEI